MWIVTFICALLGGVWFMLGTTLTNSAPQSAAVAAQAMALAIIPYVIARASSEHEAEKRRRAAERAQTGG